MAFRRLRSVALAAALILDDLHQQDLAALDHVLDLVAAHQATLQALLVGHAAFVVAVVAFAAEVIVIVVVRGRLGHDGFAVGDGDLIVVRVDLVEGEEAVTVATILDEGGLQAGLYAGDLGEVDVAAKLAAGLRLKVEFLNLASFDDRNAGLFRVCRIDKHGL